jgi:hypothetical protein
MYKSHKRYVEDFMIKETPEISPKELAVQLNIPLGEALVLLDEISGSKTQDRAWSSSPTASKSGVDRSLLEYSK